MPITIIAEDNTQHLFDDGTDPATIQFQMQKYRNSVARTVPTGPMQDSFWTSSPAGRILDAWNMGAKHNWGTSVIAEDSWFTKKMQETGLLKTYDENTSILEKAVNEALIRPAAGALYAGAVATQGVLLTIPTVLGGTLQAIKQLGVETGTQKITEPIAAIPEAAAGLIGVPPVPPMALGLALARWFGPKPTLPAILAEAKGARVIGEGDGGFLGTNRPYQFTASRQLDLPLPGFRQAIPGESAAIEVPKGSAPPVVEPVIPTEPVVRQSPLVNEKGEFLTERFQTVEDVQRAWQEGITEEQVGVRPTIGELTDLAAATGKTVANLTMFTSRGQVDSAVRMLIQSASEVKAAADAVPSGRVAVGTAEIARFLEAKAKHDLIVEGLTTTERTAAEGRAVLPDATRIALEDRGYKPAEIAAMTAEDVKTAMELPKKVEPAALQKEIETTTKELEKAREELKTVPIEETMDKVIQIEQLEKQLAALQARQAAPPTPAAAGGAPPTPTAGGGPPGGRPPTGGAPPPPPPPTGGVPPAGPPAGPPPTPQQQAAVARGTSHLKTPAQVAKYTGDSRVFTYPFELFINSLLSAVGSQMTYLASQASMVILHSMEVGLAGVLGAGLRGVGLAKGGIPLREFMAGLYALRKGNEDGIIAAWSAAKTGIPLNLQGQVTPIWLQNYGARAIPGPFGAVINMPARITFTVPDAYFRSVQMAQGLAEMAYRAAWEEGHNPETPIFAQRVAYWEANPTTAMITEAREGTNARNLMGPGGELTRKFTEAMDTGLFGGTPIAGRWGRFITPFIHISSVIWREGVLERTPVGLLSPQILANLSGRRGEAAQQLQIARMALTTSVITAIAHRYDLGDITGPPPDSPAGKETWRAQGKLPWSVRIGNSYHSYEALGPFALQLGMIGAGFEIRDYLNKGDLEKMNSAIFNSIEQALINTTWLRGPVDLFDAIREPHRYAYQYISHQLTSFVPDAGAFRWWEQQMDPYQREVYSLWDGVKSGLPYLSETLHPRIGWDGEPIPTRRSSLVPGSAIYSREITNDPVANALDRVGMAVPTARPEIKGVKLTPAQWEEYARLSGRMNKLFLQNVVSMPGFESLEPGLQRYNMQKAIDMSHKFTTGLTEMQNFGIVITGLLGKINELTSTSLIPKRGPFMQPESIPSRVLGR